MKKITWFIMTMLFTVNVRAQQAVLFKVKYLPNHVYKMSMVTDMSMGLVSAGKLKTEKNVPLGILMQGTNSTIRTIIKTGGMGADNSLPITMEITDMAIKLNALKSKTPMPNNPYLGQIIYGQYDTDGQIHIDSIAGNKSNKQLSAVMLNMINKSRGQIKFPEKPMAIGEVITKDTSINVPGKGNVKATYTYKLAGIKSNKAYFDINISMNGNVSKNDITVIHGSIKTQQIEVNVTGSGTGKLIFDIEKNYTVSKSEVLNIRSNTNAVNAKGAVMNLKMTMDLKNQIDAI